jgi:Lhr-like helicase
MRGFPLTVIGLPALCAHSKSSQEPPTSLSRVVGANGSRRKIREYQVTILALIDVSNTRVILVNVRSRAEELLDSVNRIRVFASNNGIELHSTLFSEVRKNIGRSE